MKKLFKILLIVLALLFLGILAVKGLSKEDDWICSNGSWIKHGNPRDPMPITACPVKKTIPVEKNIIVTEPKDNAVVSTSFLLSGKARVFENLFSFRLKDSDGKVIASGQIIANAAEAGQYGDFSKTITFIKPKTNSGTLDVFDNSAKDGSEIDLVSISLAFK